MWLVALVACTSPAPGPGPAKDSGTVNAGLHPTPGTTWQLQLQGDIDTSVPAAVFDVDLFDTPDDVLATLQADRQVICYFSAGSFEDWRADADAFPADVKGKPLDGWPGEWWLDIRDPRVRVIMQARLDTAVGRGCDGVDPDNVDGYANKNGLGLTADDQLDYDAFLADEAHARGLSVGLKNDLDQIPALVDRFDWVLDEECVAYDECERLAPFTSANKAAFHVEYVDAWKDAQAKADAVCGIGPELSTMVKTWDLGPEYFPCP